MFVLNIKLNYKKILCFCIISGLLFATIIKFGSKETVATTNNNIDYIVNETNYIDTLEILHNNLTDNINKTIKVSGFVYTVPELKENTYICGRYLENDSEIQIAGYVFHYEGDLSLISNEWIEITGVISEGDLNGKVPIIEVNKLEKIIAPANMYLSKKK